jgi:hypothetical protein
MKWRVPRMWDGADVWIIGGGPSITKQFEIPDNVVKAVVSGSSPPNTYSPYMLYLHDKHVIGINVAYLLGDWIDLVFFGDNGFFNNHKSRLINFPNLKVSCIPEALEYNWLKHLSREPKKSKGISSNNECVCWNSNSGASAISIAVHAGAKRIYLLGFDMKLNEISQQHWHDLYGRGIINDPKKINKLPFTRHLFGFPLIAQDAKKLGVEIINVSPDSAINCFPKISMKQI